MTGRIQKLFVFENTKTTAVALSQKDVIPNQEGMMIIQTQTHPH